MGSRAPPARPRCGAVSWPPRPAAGTAPAEPAAFRRVRTRTAQLGGGHGDQRRLETLSPLPCFLLFLPQPPPRRRRAPAALPRSGADIWRAASAASRRTGPGWQPRSATPSSAGPRGLGFAVRSPPLLPSGPRGRRGDRTCPRDQAGRSQRPSRGGPGRGRWAAGLRWGAGRPCRVHARCRFSGCFSGRRGLPGMRLLCETPKGPQFPGGMGSPPRSLLWRESMARPSELIDL